MNEEPQTSFWEKLRHVLRPHLLVAVLVAFLVGMGVSPLLTDTQGKVEAAYSSGVEEGQSTAEASYQSQLAEQEEEFSSQLSQQESDWKSQAQEEYNNGYSAGYDEGYKEGYAQGQSEAQEEISRLEEEIAAYEEEQSSVQASQSGGVYQGSSYTGESFLDYETEPPGGTVYWTPNGKSYHTSENCPTLSRSKTILSGTIDAAIYTGHGDPCDVCH